MAAAIRPTSSSELHECDLEMTTRDHEDHSFAGIMFCLDVQPQEGVPVEYAELSSISVRGNLGQMTVWIQHGSFKHTHEDQTKWTKVHDSNHPPSFRKLTQLVFDRPVRVKPGGILSVYVHSQQPDDTGLVYDNRRQRYHHDGFVRVHPGIAHLCNEPFAGWHPWGSWRSPRSFVGKIGYGVWYVLWNPDKHLSFPRPFQDVVAVLLFTKRKPDCPISWLSDDCLFYILNMMHPSWLTHQPTSGGRAPVGDFLVGRVLKRLAAVVQTAPAHLCPLRLRHFMGGVLEN